MIRVSNLTKQFHGQTILSGVSTHICKGECVAIIGPSGTGKSLFLRMIAMLERPDSGEVFIDGTGITQRGVDLNQVRERMGMVYQGFHLFTHLTVLDNITLAPRWVKNCNPRQAEAKARELLAMVGLAEKAGRFPHELSGGQQQRVAIARCLAMEPDIMLFDEPTSALDPTMTREILAIIRKLTKLGLTMVIVTHEMQFAREIAGRIFYMDDHGIYEEGSPADIFLNPKRARTKSFIERLKTFNFSIQSHQFDLVAMNAEIEIFCERCGISAEKVYHIELILEELLVRILTRCYSGGKPDMEFHIGFSDECNAVSIHLTFRTHEFNPFIHDPLDIEDLGLVLVDKIAKERRHEFRRGVNDILVRL